MPTRWPTPSPTPCWAPPGSATSGATCPTTDPRWQGADSLDLLARVVALAADAGWVPVNADCTVVAERPRLAPHVDRMAELLSGVLGAPVNVKATRAEGLGALGRAEGIACTAVVLLRRRRRGRGPRPPGTEGSDESGTSRRRTGQAVAGARPQGRRPGRSEGQGQRGQGRLDEGQGRLGRAGPVAGPAPAAGVPAGRRSTTAGAARGERPTDRSAAAPSRWAWAGTRWRAARPCASC